MLYHGSKTNINGNLEPRLSYEGKKYVYATDDYYYALVRSGAFSYDKYYVREEYFGTERPYQLAELYSGAFEELFNRPGYIYLLNDDGFVDLYPNQFVSEIEVPYVKKIEIPCVWDEIQKHIEHYELIRHEDSEEYWKTVRGGREGYIKRKVETAERIKRGLV